MNSRTLIARGLRFHWRSHLGVALGAAVATAVLVGALAAGDSVRASLRRMALARLGRTEVALAAGDRFFGAGLAGRLCDAIGRDAAPVLLLGGTAARQDGAARANSVQVAGVGPEFWRLAAAASPPPPDAPRSAALNERLARHLDLKAGDAILVRVGKPSAIPLDAPLSGEAEPPPAFHLTVAAIVGDEHFGRFSLQANQAAPYNVFVPREWLAEQVEHPDRANVLLVGSELRRVNQSSPDETWTTPDRADDALARAWTLGDAELALVPRGDRGEPGGVELRSRRVFLDAAVEAAAAAADPRAVGILAYFAIELRVGERAAPYSLVAALGRLNPQYAIRNPQSPDPRPSTLDALLPPDLADDEIVINSWLAEDLAAGPGDRLEMAYYAVGPGRRLETRSARLRIRAVVPLEGAAADPTLMPDFPGLADVENCRDWKPGVAIDLKKIRPKDEDYWNRYRGTPKAFVALAAGQKMWATRFGGLTAVRFPQASDPQAVEARLRAGLDPRSLGLYFRPVREQAIAAVRSATDFGGLFLGLSIFLVAAALVLAGLLFALQVEQRTEEAGTLLALGLPPRQVRRLFLAEGGAPALAAGAAGGAAGILYTRAMLGLLAGAWAAGGAADLRFHAEPLTLVLGIAGGLAAGLAAIAATVRRLARAPARELLAAGAEAELRPAAQGRTRLAPSAALAVLAAVGGGAVLELAPEGGGEAAAGAFFAAGALFLVGCLAFCRMLMTPLARPAPAGRFHMGRLVLRSVAARRGRSLAVVALLACGVFLVAAVGVFRQGAERDPERRASGTGGFALYAESSVPVVYDLNSPAGRRAFALPDDLARDMKVVPLRLRDGDDASCLNLNRPQNPRLAAVRPEELAARGAFAFTEALGAGAGENPWLLLAQRPDDGAVPAIADQATITWALGKKAGDTLDYTDERGQPFKVRLVGGVANSILQGSIVISEDAFIEKFPSAGGWRVFLVDAPRGRADEAAQVLSRQMSDVGLAVTPAAERLAAFTAVENAYVSIFQALGGLGLVLGSIGLGVVVLRNVMERREELAVMRAVGFPVRLLRRLILWEHWLLLGLGLAAGLCAAGGAVVPAVRAAGAEVPYLLLGATLAAVLASGLAWTYLAARLALRGPLLDALRNE
ncbi:MAG: FtsX-like permease family protein [Planctomycetes bacterium]|nr:FtsX-like permease family protein [Planctomycetota bacterium]